MPCSVRWIRIASAPPLLMLGALSLQGEWK